MNKKICLYDGVPQGRRPERPPNCPQETYKLMLDTWRATPNRRPSFAELKPRLSQQELQARVKAGGKPPRSLGALSEGKNMPCTFDKESAVGADDSDYTRPVAPMFKAEATWYHGVCSRVVAERTLLSAGDPLSNEGTFLVRNTPREGSEIVLSVIFKGKPWHYKSRKANVVADGFMFYGQKFRNVEDMVEYHYENKGKLFGLLGKSCKRY
eukprot:m.166389 g.166389  ORF g.166389 m.166389 type:complete len:211 (-) comp15278_c0_seq3:3388-4020(-)